MKVKVKIKHAPLNQVEYFLNEALAEALADLDTQYRENERLLQENKDLRLAEARALSDKKKAEDDFSRMKKNYSDACADRDNLEAAYKQQQLAFTNCTCQMNNEYNELSDECYDLRDQLRDREARIEELEYRIRQLENEASIHEEEKEAFEATVRIFDETRKEYEAEIKRVNQQKQELYQQLGEAQKRADVNHQLNADKDDEISTQRAIITVYKGTLEDRDAKIAQLQEDLDNCRKQLVEANKKIQILPPFNSVWDVLKTQGLIKEDASNG